MQRGPTKAWLYRAKLRRRCAGAARLGGWKPPFTATRIAAATWGGGGPPACRGAGPPGPAAAGRARVPALTVRRIPGRR